MCNCITMLRLPDIETQDGKYPMPKHAPRCEDFKQEDFSVITINGSSCIVENHDVQGIVLSEDEYVVSAIKLTRDQFDNLKEFSGF